MIFSEPSSRGSADDEALAAAVARAGVDADSARALAEYVAACRAAPPPA